MNPGRLRHWLSERYPDHPFHVAGAKGSALLYHVLCQSGRSLWILPGFTCPELAFLGVAAGRQLRIVDSDPHTLNMDLARLRQTLQSVDTRDAVLLVDHAFGYPCAWLEDVRREWPDLLLVEDAVRALNARVADRWVGNVGDLALFSLYKAVPGNTHGALLIARKPISMPQGPVLPFVWRNALSTIGLARWFYERQQRRRPAPQAPVQRPRAVPAWKPFDAQPSQQTWRYSDRYVVSQTRDRDRWQAARTALEAGLAQIPGVVMPAVAPATQPGLDFVSFLLDPGLDKFALMGALQTQGLPLLGTWDLLPMDYGDLHQSAALGSDGSRELAQRVVHIPLCKYLRRDHQRELMAALKQWLADPARSVRAS